MKTASSTSTRLSKQDTSTKLICAVRVFVCLLYASVATAEGENLDKGKGLYEFYCYQCHGYSGDARTTAASYLDPKPRDFTQTDPSRLTRQQMLAVVQQGLPATAMMSFARVLSDDEMAAVVDYIRATLMGSRPRGLAYHTAANGWEKHQRYKAAFEFASNTLRIDKQWKDLNPEQRVGKQLFLSACITCHEPRSIDDAPLQFEPRAVSYPRSTDTCVDCHAGRPRELLPFSTAEPNALTVNTKRESLLKKSGASPYLKHGRAKLSQKLSESELRGKELFLANCAFCHAADGSSRNWVGSFLEPRPRQLRPGQISSTKSSSYLRAAIRDGIAGTSMPAWRTVLQETQIADLIAFLLHGRRTPIEVDSPVVSTRVTAPPPRWTRQNLFPAASLPRTRQQRQ
ncbi:MAG: c-type cytochrome [Betaproteobacteria bacterium]|nr:MAG: c-type cytochrome [Betaproteobacteria bacterium]